MKKLILIVLAIACMGVLLYPPTSFAAPFLGCVSYVAPAVIPDRFKLTVDGGTEVVAPLWSGTADGVAYTNIFHYDLAGLAVGNHTANVKACKGDPLWGQEVCSTVTPFSFSKPSPPVAAPLVPTGLLLLPQ